MKQEILDQIVDIESKMLNLQREIQAKQKEIESLEVKRHQMTHSCDHKYPDGRDAGQDLWLHTACKICLVCD